MHIKPAIGQRWTLKGTEHMPDMVQTIAEGPKYDHQVPNGVDGEWWWCSNGSGIYTEEIRKGFYVLVDGD